MNCHYKVKITDIQTKYKFKVFCTGYDDSEIKEKIDVMYQAWPKATAEGETPTLDNTVNATMSIDLKGNTSQEGTPTPDAPVEVETTTGDNTINIVGKNLFDKTRIISGKRLDNKGLPSISDNYCTTDYFIAVEPNTTYYSTSVINQAKAVCFYDSNQNFIERVMYLNLNTFTTGSTTHYIKMSILLSEIDMQQLEKSSEATTYEPYQSQSYPINLGDIELCKIGDYQDKIYKDNGKWYKYSAIGKIVLKGSGNTELYGDGGTATDYWEYFRANLIGGVGTAITVFSNYFNQTTNSRVVIINNGTLYLRFPKASGIDVSTNTLLNTWLSTHNTIVYYALATPTTTEITDSTLISQLNALAEAESYTGQTNISQTNDDLPFIISASALYDLNNLVTRVAILETE